MLSEDAEFGLQLSPLSRLLPFPSSPLSLLIVFFSLALPKDVGQHIKI